MKKVIIVAIAALSIAGCTATEKGAVVGGASGAAIGAAVSGNSTEGAIVGGVVGATAGALIDKASEPGMCIYEDRYGNQYRAKCPA